MARSSLWLGGLVFFYQSSILHTEDHQPQLCHSHRKPDGGTRRFWRRQSLCGKDSMCRAVILKLSRLRREKEGVRRGEASGRDGGEGFVLSLGASPRSRVSVSQGLAPHMTFFS